MEIKIRRTKSFDAFHVLMKTFGDLNFHPFILPEEIAGIHLNIDTFTDNDIDSIIPNRHCDSVHNNSKSRCVFYDEIHLVSISAVNLQQTIDKVVENIKSSYKDYQYKKYCESLWDKNEDEIVILK